MASKNQVVGDENTNFEINKYRTGEPNIIKTIRNNIDSDGRM